MPVTLNLEQRSAIKHIDSPLLVLAGAGSGKTGVITQKINWLLENGFSDEEIIAVTFTNKAAMEMRQRVAELHRDSNARSLQISTFHRLGMRILFREAGLVGLRPSFSIVTRDDVVAMLANFAPALQQYDAKQVAQLVDIISYWKNRAIMPEEINGMLDANSSPMEQMAASVYADFEAYLIACNSVDLDGLLTLPLRIFKTHPDALERWQDRCRYLLVDEYQDTNRVQYELIRLLATKHGGLTVVGDDDQSIYTWRGADAQNLEYLEQDFPTLKVIKLEQNYRCTNTILKAANALIANNPRKFEKNLWSEGDDGTPIHVMSCQDEADEASAVVEAISGRAFVQNLNYSHFAILLRSNHQARHFEKALRESRIPYIYTGGQSLFERTEIKDVLAYLRIIANAEDTAAFLRIINTPRRGIGATTLTQLAEFAQRFGKSLPQVCAQVDGIQSIKAAQRLRVSQFVSTLSEIRAQSDELGAEKTLDLILKEVEYFPYLEEHSESPMRARVRIDRVLELKKWIANMQARGKNLSEIINDLALLNRDDNKKDEEGRVNLCTMHSAKGLEFDHVFVAGLEEGILPHHNSIEADTVEEERRLMYVAITRARKSLSLSYCLGRKANREKVRTEPSRFLGEIPHELTSGEADDEIALSASEFTARLDDLLASFEGDHD